MITLTHDPVYMPSSLPQEHCCFCAAETRMWAMPADVAVCADCAAVRDYADLPNKETWCASPQGRGESPYPPGTTSGDAAAYGAAAAARKDDAAMETAGGELSGLAMRMKGDPTFGGDADRVREIAAWISVGRQSDLERALMTVVGATMQAMRARGFTLDPAAPISAQFAAFMDDLAARKPK